MQLLPALQLQREQPQLRLKGVVSHDRPRGGKFHRLVEFLQVIDQEMRPWPIYRLHLANNPFLEIEPPLAPPENLSDG